MTRSDRWRKRKPVLKYFAYKDELKSLGFTLPECNYHIIFVLPMSKSWSNKKKLLMDGKPHQQVPDKDNLEKAVLDAIFENDSHIWDGRVSKIWGKEGLIIVKEISPPEL